MGGAGVAAYDVTNLGFGGNSAENGVVTTIEF